MKERPNILILMSDEHRFDVAGFAGNEIVRTPNLDKLASEGVVFNNCYAASPICAPSRQCLAAGQLTKTCNVAGSWMDLAPGYHTFAKRFSQYAYKTVCSGKLHHLGKDQMQGWSIRLAPDAEIYDKYKEGLIKEEFLNYSSGKSKNKMTDEAYVKEAAPGIGRSQTFDQFAYAAMDNYIKFNCNKEDARPHLLKLSLIQPHFPYFTEADRFQYYYDRVSIYEEGTMDHPVLSLSQDYNPVKVSSEEIRRATATYYGMIESIDDYYGRIMQSLQDKGYDLDEWIIIYLSDHGEMLGQHGIWEKTRFFEASVRTPLIIRYPKKFSGGRLVQQNVNLCDLFSTLCDLADIPVQPGLDSRSLVPLMEGRSEKWINESISQIRRKNEDHVMIKQDDLKYQYYGEQIPEVLFDLKVDPRETINLINDEKYEKDVIRIRERLSALGYGPKADENYKNAGYESGVAEKEIGNETLWPADSNPWLDKLS